MQLLRSPFLDEQRKPAYLAPILNENTNQYVEVGFTAFPGYALSGNSAEWVVEARRSAAASRL